MKHRFKLGQMVKIEGEETPVKIIGKTSYGYVVQVKDPNWRVFLATMTDCIAILKGTPMDRSIFGRNVDESRVQKP